MNDFVPAPLKQMPWRFLLLVMAVGGFGATILYSAAGGSLSPWAFSHLVRFGVFLTMAIIMSRIPIRLWEQFSYPAYLGVLTLLILVELVGAVGGGSQRWLDLGFIRLQPSELMKLVIILAVAKFYASLPAGEIRKFNAIWPAAIIIGIPAAFVLIQPDLGTRP